MLLKDVRRLYTPKFRNSCFGWDHRIDYQTYFAGYFPASCIGSYPNDHFLFLNKEIGPVDVPNK